MIKSLMFVALMVAMAIAIPSEPRRSGPQTRNGRTKETRPDAQDDEDAMAEKMLECTNLLRQNGFHADGHPQLDNDSDNDTEEDARMEGAMIDGIDSGDQRNKNIRKH